VSREAHRHPSQSPATPQYRTRRTRTARARPPANPANPANDTNSGKTVAAPEQPAEFRGRPALRAQFS